MRNLLFILVLIAGGECYPQLKKIFVSDGATGEPVPFVAVSYNNGRGLYGDENGIFYIDVNSENNITLNHIAYKTKKIQLPLTSDTLKLEQDLIDLKEIIIDKQKWKKTKFAYDGRDAKFHWFFIPATEFMVFIKPTDRVADMIIDSFHIPCSIAKNKNDTANKFVFKSSIYDNERTILSSKTSEFTLEELKDKGVFYSPAESIAFADKGLYFGVELLGWYTKSNLFENNTLSNYNSNVLRLDLVKANDYNTYYHNPFENNREWQHINAQSKLLRTNKGDSRAPKNINVQINLIIK